MRHLNSVVQGEYRDRVIVVHPQLRLYTRALGVFDALKGKVEMTAPRFNVRKVTVVVTARIGVSAVWGVCVRCLVC